MRPPVDDEEVNHKTDNGEEFLSWVKSAVREDPNPTASAPVFVEPPVAKVENTKRRMTIISSSGTETYAWSNDGEIPQKELTPKEDSIAPSDQLVSGSSPYEPSNSQSPPSGMVWDGKQWTSQPSGFKPAYPSADDEKKKKSGYSESSGNNSPKGKSTSGR